MRLRIECALYTTAISVLLPIFSGVCGAPPIEAFDSEGPSSIQFSPDNRLLLKGRLRFVDLWNVETRRSDRMPLHDGICVHIIAFSGDGRLMALELGRVQVEDTVELYSWPQKQLLARYDNMSAGICQFSRDGSLLMMKPFHKNIIVSDVGPGKAPGRAGMVSGTEAVTHAVLSPDGSKVAYVSAENCVPIWDVTKSEVRKTLCPSRRKSDARIDPIVARGPAPTNYTYQLAFTPNGRYLVTASIGNEPDLAKVGIWEAVHWERFRSISYRQKRAKVRARNQYAEARGR